MDLIDSPPETVAKDYRLAAAAFQAAARRHPDRLIASACRLAGRPVRLRIIGPRLADEVIAALAHLQVADGGAEPFLTIDVWHEAETGVGAERHGLPAQLGSYGVMSASEDGSYVVENRPHSAAWLDRRERRVLAWVAASERLHLDERARPWHRVLAVALSDLDIQTIHAGLVARDGRGALLVGKGGSGKSTASICCLLAGLTYLSDDFVGLAAAPDGGFVGHSLYSSALIGLGHMSAYPDLAAVCRPGRYADEEKLVVCLGGMDAAHFGTEVAIRAVILPRVAGTADTQLSPAAARDALLALAPSSLLYLPGVGPKSMQRLGALVGQVPSYRLDLGHDLRQIAPQLANLLAGS
jgi:hypothetical protein